MRIGCNVLYPDIEARRADGWRFEPFQIIKALETLREIGYTDVEYSHVAHLTQREAELIGEAATHIGIRSWSCHSTFVPMDVDTEEAIQQSIQRHTHCAEIAATIGAGVLVVHPTGAPTESSSAASTEAILNIHMRILERVCSRARGRGVTIALENGGSLAQMHYIVDLVEKLDCGICVDTGHANLGNLGATQAIQLADSRLVTTHLQDNWGERDDHRPPGTGTIEWIDVFLALKQIGYHETLMLELTDGPPTSREYDQDIELRMGLRNVRAFSMAVGMNG